MTEDSHTRLVLNWTAGIFLSRLEYSAAHWHKTRTALFKQRGHDAHETANGDPARDVRRLLKHITSHADVGSTWDTSAPMSSSALGPLTAPRPNRVRQQVPIESQGAAGARRRRNRFVRYLPNDMDIGVSMSQHPSHRSREPGTRMGHAREHSKTLSDRRYADRGFNAVRAPGRPMYDGAAQKSRPADINGNILKITSEGPLARPGSRREGPSSAREVRPCPSSRAAPATPGLRGRA
jgi:hypothetical protein